MALTAAGLVAGCSSSDDHDAPGSASASVGPEMAVAPSTPPSGVSWVGFHGVALPQGDQGPRTGQDTAAPSGYTHNGPGAGLAAANAVVRMSIASDNEFAAVAGLIAPGAGRDAWQIARSQLSITSDVPAGKAPALLGYTIDSYRPDVAGVTIIDRQPDQSLTATTVSMVWALPGGWLRSLPYPAPTAPAVRSVSAVPAGMIAFGGTSG